MFDPDFPFLTQAPVNQEPPPKAPKRVVFDDKTSYVARLQSQLTREEVEHNRLASDARMAESLSPTKKKRFPTPGRGLPLKTLNPNKLSSSGGGNRPRKPKRTANSPAKDPTKSKRSDIKPTPNKKQHGADEPQIGSEKQKEQKKADVSSPKKNVIHLPPTPDSIPEGIRESIGEREYRRERASLEGFPSFDSGEYDLEQEALHEQKELEEEVKQDQWEEYKNLVANGKDPGVDLKHIEALDCRDWKVDAEAAELDRQQCKRDKADAAFLEDCRCSMMRCESDEERKPTAEEQVLLQEEKEEKNASEKADEAYRKERIQEHKKEMASQVAWEEDENISEPGECGLESVVRRMYVPDQKVGKKTKPEKPKPDPLMFIKGRGRQPTKTKRTGMTVDGTVRVGLPEKPKEITTILPVVEPAPLKQWLVRTGLTPEEIEKKKKKDAKRNKTIIKDEWMASQEKLINSLVEELAKQLKAKLKVALKERPEAITILLGDGPDIKATRAAVLDCLMTAIERKKERDAKKKAADERRAAKAANVEGATTSDDAAGGSKHAKKK